MIPSSSIRHAQRRGQDGGQRPAEIGLALRVPELRRVREARQELRLRQQELGQQLAAGAELDQVQQQVGVVGEELQVARAGPHRGDEPLELVQALVGVRALPECLQQDGKEPAEGPTHGIGVRNQRAAFQDQAEILARPLRVGEAGGLERVRGRNANPNGLLPRGGLEEGDERPVDVAGHLPVLRQEPPRRALEGERDAHPARQPAQRGGLLRQGVDLKLVEDLEPVLHRAEVGVAVAQDAPQGVREIAALDQAEDRPEAVPLPEPGVVAAVEQLEGLHQKLHLADPARPQLDVQALVALGLERAVDLALHGANLGQDPTINPRLIDVGADQVEEPPPDTLVACAEARLDQRLALPE